MKKKRKPYRPPVIRSEKVYDRKSLACTKVAGQSIPCTADPKQS